MQRATTVLVFALAVVGASLVLPVAASPQPTPVCPVCGQTFQEDVTATEATLQVQQNGDVRWHVENDVADPTATAWRENETAARHRVEDRIDWRGSPPYDPAALDVAVADQTVVIEFVDRGAARSRFGLLVLPYLHGEGVEARYVVNADEFVIEAPEGQRITNEPAGATVEDDRAVWSGVASVDDPMEGAETWTAPEPGDTYVVVGAGPTTAIGTTLALTFEPLFPRLYGFYAVGLLVALGLSSVGYVTARRELHRRWLATGATAAAIPYVVFVLSWHPIQPAGTLPGTGQRVVMLLIAAALGLVAALVLFAVAATRPD